MKELKILVTNDDGIGSKGIRCLVEIAKEFGKVTVVAPNKPQSAMGHAITISKPLRLKRNEIFGPDVIAYECTGTPVDCVKLAIDQVFEGKPDLCLSGINHGSNSSINIIYSGTMSAAMEAAIDGINAIGFSNLDYDADSDFSTCIHYARIIIQNAIEKGFGDTNLLNVNFPKLPLSEVKGFKICKQAQAAWLQEYEEREDPFGRKYYWLTGKFVNYDEDETADQKALENGYVSVVPVQFDLTAYKAIDHLQTNWQQSV